MRLNLSIDTDPHQQLRLRRLWLWAGHLHVRPQKMFGAGFLGLQDVLAFLLSYCLLVALLMKGAAVALRALGVGGIAAGRLRYLLPYTVGAFLVMVLAHALLAILAAPANPVLGACVFMVALTFVPFAVLMDPDFRARRVRVAFGYSALFAFLSAVIAWGLVYALLEVRYG